MSTDRLEIKPDDTSETLEQSAEKLKNDGVDVSKDIAVNAQGEGAKISEPKTEMETTEQRPEWLPEKFSNAEELAKAYTGLQKEFSSRPKEEAKPTEEVQEVENKGLDKYYTEFAETGELAEKSYAELAEQGLDKTLVDSYISGQQALADKHVSTIHSVVGGKEKYDTIVKWASDTLADNEVKAFNDTMDSGTLDQAQLAISGIQAKFNSVNQEPALFSGEKADTSSGAYRSVGEMLTDINNPRYSTDSAFRADVEDKVKASNVL